MTELPWIDWDAAEQVALQLVKPGPGVTRGERDQIVGQLRQQARRATEIIIDASGLPLAGQARELVVDRRNLVRVNVATARRLTDSLGPAPDGPLGQAAGRARGTTIGGLLASLGGRILGQYDPFGGPPTLYLVAPTIMAVERQLKVDPTDFRMWVVLHEQTHRVQFANAPWLPDHLVGLVVTMLTADEQPLWQNLDQRLAKIRRDRAEGRPISLRLINAVSAPELVAALDQVTAVMSLLEGHADVMMDRAGRSVIPSVATIRARFNARRARGGIHGLVNRLLGMDAKLAQYADGARFCRQVIRRGGVGLLNRVFESPATMPALPELLHPEQWYERMTGVPRDADGQA
ncbi:MAG: zinc-dependent metalloprotease [Brooklawnia sp.]|uniref:zinc-dependent metalloprotease n=1 Tax=Brooklawnia sp. TaxID=2699740 RepID=UPI003C709F62